MDEADIRRVVQATLDAEAERRDEQLDGLVLKAVAAILTSFGVEDGDQAELRADFIHLRKWRKSVEQAQSLTFRTVVLAILSGLLGALWLGLKALLGK